MPGLARPCSNCPFLKGSVFETSMCRARAQEIATTLYAGHGFPCHKTTDAGGSSGPQQWCPGAIGTMQNEGIAWDNQLVQVMARLGAICAPEDLGGLDECYDSLAEWVRSHKEGR